MEYIVKYFDGAPRTGGRVKNPAGQFKFLWFKLCATARTPKGVVTEAGVLVSIKDVFDVNVGRSTDDPIEP